MYLNTGTYEMEVDDSVLEIDAARKEAEGVINGFLNDEWLTTEEKVSIFIYLRAGIDKAFDDIAESQGIEPIKEGNGADE